MIRRRADGGRGLEHFLSIMETPTPRLRDMLRRAVSLRTRREPVLAGRSLCCLFEKSSLRTRVSFEQAMRRLGGHAMSMSQAEVGLGGRESPEDVARVLGGMVDVVMARVRSQQTLVRMAAPNAVPIINGLSDEAHPCQALADVLTLADEFAGGDVDGLAGRTVAFVGDGNNVARSLLAACAKLGINFRMCAPPGYGLAEAYLARARAESGKVEITGCDDPADAAAGVDAIYCDTFVSMGQEAERDERLRVFAPYQVNEALLARAPEHAIVLHCLPASRGVEITDGVMDGPRSRVFQQAWNRVDAQMGVLAELLHDTSSGR